MLLNQGRFSGNSGIQHTTYINDNVSAKHVNPTLCGGDLEQDAFARATHSAYAAVGQARRATIGYLEYKCQASFLCLRAH